MANSKDRARMTGQRSNTQAQVHQLAREGLSDQTIAQCLNLSPTTVRNYRSKTLVSPGAPLSEREKQVSDLVRKGLPNIVIGQQLGISPRTVEVHRQQALRKLGARNATELADMRKNTEHQGLLVRIAELEAKVASLEQHIAKLEGNI
jgi:DNA-binding NarL/FixJ family response regulator